MSEYMDQKRAQVSTAKAGSPLARANVSTDVRSRPRFSTVSIIPGMLIWAPDRTDTSSGIPPA